MSSDSTRETDLDSLGQEPTKKYNRPTLARLKPLVVGEPLPPSNRPTIQVVRPIPREDPHDTEENPPIGGTASIFGRVFGIFILGLILLASISSAVVYAYFGTTDHVIPGIRFEGEMIGGLSYADALTRIHEAWDDEIIVMLDDGIEVYEAPVTDFGIEFDASATADNAYAVGHDGNVIANFTAMMSAMMFGRDVAPVMTINRDLTEEAMAHWADLLYIPPQNASLDIEGTSVEVVEALPGRQLNFEETLSMIVVYPARLIEERKVELVFVEVVPTIFAADLGEFVDEAEALLAAEVSIEVYEPVTGEYRTFTATPEDIANWLMIEDGEDGPEIIISDEASDDTLAAFAKAFEEPAYIDLEKYSGVLARNLRGEETPTLVVNHHPTTYTVEGYESLLWIGWLHGIPYWHFADANPDVNLDSRYPGMEITVPSIDVMFPVEVVTDRRIVISISHQRMYLYEHGEQVQTYIISTGMSDSPTMPGVFQVFMRDPWAYGSSWDLWMPHFLGIYDSVPGFTNGIHGLPTLSSGGILWANVLGTPASYGCIILNLGPDAFVYDWAADGTIVEIQR